MCAEDMFLTRLHHVLSVCVHLTQRCLTRLILKLTEKVKKYAA